MSGFPCSMPIQHVRVPVQYAHTACQASIHVKVLMQSERMNE
jgi:hypothetical protein